MKTKNDMNDDFVEAAIAAIYALQKSGMTNQAILELLVRAKPATLVTRYHPSITRGREEWYVIVEHQTMMRVKGSLWLKRPKCMPESQRDFDVSLDERGLFRLAVGSSGDNIKFDIAHHKPM